MTDKTLERHNAYTVGYRVQLPAYTDAWMRGDRYGEIRKVTRNKQGAEIAHVLCDVSRKTRKVLLDDCAFT